ncbi:winged helix-turn-helix transcriptional regulator [Zestomonas carbonaria]|uniref:HTH hxlR-type domain-containing protein n=1 Tax=Zestomonas carbonaria TaxID=2762745 RepID=A0A7U7ELQ5_9GAMM|nr:helix-turn-helix domain-containing protein [Pseudomonas carbonaria]CAD5107324.1 hypothetical protein PSEWESI4_01595 [Pseudomonas carbonaria]
MKTQAKKVSPPLDDAKVYRCLEEVIGCKWSVSVLVAAGDGINRPGALQKHIPGLSTKVLNERLRKLTHYGLLEQIRYAESPPRTEYLLTPFGRELVELIGRIRHLDQTGRAGRS